MSNAPPTAAASAEVEVIPPRKQEKVVQWGPSEKCDCMRWTPNRLWDMGCNFEEWAVCDTDYPDNPPSKCNCNHSACYACHANPLCPADAERRRRWEIAQYHCLCSCDCDLRNLTPAACNCYHCGNEKYAAFNIGLWGPSVRRGKKAEKRFVVLPRKDWTREETLMRLGHVDAKGRAVPCDCDGDCQAFVAPSSQGF